ncbi:MAG: TonB-dependent receptor [Bacteroidales bacterium]|nr:TonB-dependent receptor [Bacteroidales bacterium]
MKYNSGILLRALLLGVMLIGMSAMVDAQPGGPGGPPPGGGFPGGRPPMGKRPPMGDWNRMGDDQKAQQVKQKKKVKEGDTFKVVGSLRDSVSGEFLAFVNVAVLDSADTSFIKGASTNFDGLFEVTEIPAGAYLLRVSAIGYQNVLIPFNVTNNTALGTLRLKPGATTLKEVSITAEKPLYAMDGEKMIYNVSEDPSIQTGTTEDALQNAPGVEVDVEGNITLRGVSSVEIWINDKPSKLTEENLKTYLQTLPANALARIEAITNPSAKYATDAEAVINIVTSAHIKSNQFISFGVNGATQPFVSPWVSYMWAKEKLSINFFASGRYSYRENTTESWSLMREATPTGPGDTTMKDTTFLHSLNNSYSGNFFLGINYEVDSMTELSFDAGGFYNNNGSSSDSWRGQTFYLATGDSLTNDTTLSRSGSDSYNAHVGVDYTKKYDQEGHNLRVGANARFSHNASEQWYNRMYDTYTDRNEHRLLLTNNYNYGASFDARYNRPYSKDGEMSYGLRADVGMMNNDYLRYNDTLRVVKDLLRTYHFTGRDATVNADVNWTHRWGGFTLSSGLGVGLENSYYQYDSQMDFADTGEITYPVFRPSVHLTYRTEDMHNFKLNYSMRMRTPGEEDLSKFRRYSADRDSYSTGNINGLTPSYTHSVEAGWQKFFERFGNIGVEAYGRWSESEISSLEDRKEVGEDEYLYDRIVEYSIPYNMGYSWRYGASLNMTYRPTGFFNVRLYANAYNYGCHLDDYKGKPYDNDMWSYSVRVNAWTKIFNQYQIHVSANYNSPTLSLMNVRKARYSLNMGVRSDFFKRKLSVFVNVQDIFNWGGRYGSGSENTNPYYISNSTNKMVNSTYVSAGITLRFGKMELERNAKEGENETGDSL